MTALPILNIETRPVKGFLNTAKYEGSGHSSDTHGAEVPIKTWLNIPYGQANRWEHSRPAAAWSQPLDCTKFGPRFYQPVSSTEKRMAEIKGWHTREVSDSEDAFNVNVFSTNDDAPKKKVMVWIYGGSLNNGSAERPLYDPTELLRRHSEDSEGCIVVTFNYRINIFGFLAHPDLVGEDGLAGNYGVRDCLCALQWVQRNISAFSGDPNNVTVFGESAGAWLSSVLFCSGQRLFNRAILISCGPSSMGTSHLGKNCDWYDSLLAEYDITASTKEERVAALRAVPADKMLASGQKYFALGTWQLTIERGPNAMWKHSPVHSIMQGQYDPWIEQVIIGHNKDEGTMFTLGLQLQKPENLKAFMKRYPESWHSSLEDMYQISKASAEDTIVDCAGSHLFADSIFICPFLHTANVLSSVPNAETGKTIPVYAYRLDVAPEAYKDHPIAGQLGVAHAADLPLVFNMKSIFRENDIKTSAVIGRAFLDFAKDGQPHSWPAYTKNDPGLLVFKAGGKYSAESLHGFREAQMEFWTKVIEAKASSTVEDDAMPAAQTT